MFAPKRRHGRRRPKANTREGGNPRFVGFVVPPPPFWCHPKPRGSVPRCKTEKAAVRPQLVKITKKSNAVEKANAVQPPAGSQLQIEKVNHQSDYKNKIAHRKVKNAVDKFITIFGVETIFSVILPKNIKGGIM